ncbi:MAG: long-chain fatty acid--CoA ligase [Deltaproteobacteria bacterium]|nr:long-chain fatty acid--CoA ligase [Deltaproteobacteria bacterium]
MREEAEKWYVTEQTYPELLQRNAVRFKDRRAQWWKNGPDSTTSITYCKLGQIVAELASGLMALGMEKGDRAAVMAPTCPQWVWADYSILCAAGITVCLYPTLSMRETSFIVNDSGSKILYAGDEEILGKILANRKDMPLLEKIVVMKEDSRHGGGDVLNLNDLRSLGRSLLESDPSAYEQRWKSVELKDPMTIVYTSGTTGRPKGAVHTHFSFNAATRRDMALAPIIREDDVFLSFLPLAHTYERQCGHSTAIHGAVTIAYTSPKTMVNDLQIFRPTVFMSVPRIYERIFMAMEQAAAISPLKKALFDYALKVGLEVVNSRSDKDGFVDMSERADFFEGLPFLLKLKYRLCDKMIFQKVRQKLGGRFRFAFSAAGSLPADLCRIFMAMGVRIYEGYGATETCNTVTLNRPEKVLPGSVGPQCPTIEGRIEPDGEWVVRGDNNFIGYWNNPEATREAFTEDGCYKTGDIVEALADGYLKIVDRKKGLMVLDTGKNVPSAKIEALFSLSRYIDLVLPVGDNRPFVGALVIPNFDEFIKYFTEQAIPYDASSLRFSETGPIRLCTAAGEDFIKNSKLRAIVESEIDKANEQLEEHEQIKAYTILTRRLTEESGEMTPTLKIKRNVALQNFKAEIDKMFA